MVNPVYDGSARLYSSSSDYNQLSFVIRQVLGRTATAGLALVRKVDTTRQVLDVQPMVHQIDGAGKPTPHGIIHNIPYVRLQGGGGAVIIDPVVGDIGLIVYASSDISSVKNTRAPTVPGSRRRFDMADGIYLGGLLNGTPTSYVKLDAAGVATVHSPSQVVLDAPAVAASGTITVTGGDVVADGLSMKQLDVRLKRLGG